MQPADQWKRDVIAARESITIAARVNKLFVTKQPPNTNNILHRPYIKNTDDETQNQDTTHCCDA